MRDYQGIWEARAGRGASGFDEDRRQRYAAAINDRIETLMQERQTSQKPEALNKRLKRLAAIVAQIDGRNSAARVLEIMALPDEWDGWDRARALEALLFSGASLPTDATLNVLDPTIEHTLDQGVYHIQNLDLLKRCLQLLPFVDEPSVGIDRISKIVSAANIHNSHLKEVVTALGQSRCDEAFPVLIQFANGKRNDPELIMNEWAIALATLNTVDSRRTLLSFIDPDIPNPGIDVRFDDHDSERLASCIADIARAEPVVEERIHALCSLQLPLTKRLLLAQVIGLLGTQEALLAGLDLMHDATNPAIPSDLWRAAESLFLERLPVGDAGYSYTLEPRDSNAIRARLFDMALNDNARQKSAFALLGRIELWRLEYGRPTTEPRHPMITSGQPWPPVPIVSQGRQNIS